MSEACDLSKGIMLISKDATGVSVIDKINKVEKLLRKKIKEINSIRIFAIPKDLTQSQEDAETFVCSLIETAKSKQIICLVSKKDVTEDVTEALTLLQEEYCALEEELKELKDYECQN
jgi:tryptophanyl-tRNA synthetase